MDELQLRLYNLEQQKVLNTWDKLCELIKVTVEQFESTNTHIDITVDYAGDEKITIINNNYTNPL